MGKRVAHLVTGTMTDYIEFDDGFAIARTRTPQIACGHTLAESALRAKYGITIVGVKTHGEDFTYATPETSIRHTDELIVSGPTRKVEAFCALS
jgi:trk system potassium uptake protein TrkA